MTFDYLMFVVCAAWIAAMGLGTNSSATVIASMLVSPIMGPVMGLTFGTTVKKKDLIIKGLVNEIVSLIMCFVIGIIVCIFMTIGGTPETRKWPSSEMLSRGDPYGLAAGFFVAIPSGVATALSTLGKNSSGMVGVAISLSLLPPAVNAAMCWTYELMLLSPKYNRNAGDDTDYWTLGGISFALTVVNIICIWLAGTFTFKLKEVAPIHDKNAFWKEDIQEYRNNKKKDPNLNVINEGIQAALELRNSVAIKDDLYKGTDKLGIGEARAAEQRRRGLANDALEDAFFIDNRALNRETLVPGGVINLDEVKLQDAAEDTTLKAELLDGANKFGTLQDAGKALFDNNMFGSEIDMVLDDSAVPTNDIGVRHGAVAEDVLLTLGHSLT